MHSGTCIVVGPPVVVVVTVVVGGLEVIAVGIPVVVVDTGGGVGGLQFSGTIRNIICLL